MSDIVTRVLTSIQTKEFYVALFWIVLHVAHYNFTAQLEHKTRIFTKTLGSNAIYIYGGLLIFWACVRDWYIMKALEVDRNSVSVNFVLIRNNSVLMIFPTGVDTIVGGALSLIGFGINIWTLSALGFKGMYNGDSFGYLFDEPVTTGPYKYMSDPQYVGTFIAAIGSAVMYQSIAGYVKFVEGPHMRRLYAGKQKKSE
ncbi:hypothetical protein PIROE2DRAFT_5825 [Piromyces sp. E2]|nr:hypothetical protein PIROE2DRAFT_5825 [Piromyces sp. E2]|eukprot:OUM66845.1 hypothetical protein PIROE2DRAFT_5825 [Piromyces sp. E2]